MTYLSPPGEGLRWQVDRWTMAASFLAQSLGLDLCAISGSVTSSPLAAGQLMNALIHLIECRMAVTPTTP